MKIQRFILEYPSDKPLLPIQRFRLNIDSDYKNPNLEPLRKYLETIVKSLNVTPIVYHRTTSERMRTNLRLFSNLSPLLPSP